MSKPVTVNGRKYHVACNWHTRPLVPLMEIPEPDRDDFSYAELSEDDAAYDCRFFYYRGSWYDSHEFEGGADMSHDMRALGFNAWQTESYFSAVVLQYFDAEGELHDEGNSVVVGYVHW